MLFNTLFDPKTIEFIKLSLILSDHYFVAQDSKILSTDHFEIKITDWKATDWLRWKKYYFMLYFKASHCINGIN